MKILKILIISISIIFFTRLVYCEYGNYAKVKLFSGKVFVRHNSKQFHKAKINEVLTKFSEIKTGKNSYAVIFYKDSLIKVNQNSIFKLKSFNDNSDKSNIKFKLSLGSIFTKVSKLKKGDTFEVETPTAVVGVRGTEFEVDVDKDDTTVKVFSGKIP